MKGVGIALHRPKLGAIFHSDAPSFHNTNTNHHDDDVSHHSINNASPCLVSPLNNEALAPSPFTKSPWLPISIYREDSYNGLVGSIVREEGHVYSLAVSGELLYTGSDSKNIRVWKNLKDFTGFKSSSGLVKAIVISGERIFTGHQDGKIRVWKNKKNNNTNTSIHRRIGNLPTFTDYVKNSRNKIKHHDAVSCLSLDEENGLLYSGSWDKTVKIWSVQDSRLLESVDDAHSDAVNAVATGFDCYLFTGSADGTVKMWRREWEVGKGGTKKRKTKHVVKRVLLEGESAVTALAVNRWSKVVYGGSSDGAVNFWEQGTKKDGVCHGGVLRGHKLAVLCVAVAGKLVLSGSVDKNVCVWKREENGVHTRLSVLAGHAGPVKCIAAVEEEDEPAEIVQKYGKGFCQRCMVYTGSLDKSVKVWRVSENVPELKTYT